MKINHIGYAVKRLDRAKSDFEKIGFVFSPAVDDTDRNVRISFGEMDGVMIELVTPLDRKKQSPVDEHISKAPGTPYHICYESNNLDDEIEKLEKQGFKVVIEPRPAVAFGGKRVVFMITLGFGLMEIVEM